jgi:hypothetical protein
MHPARAWGTYGLMDGEMLPGRGVAFPPLTLQGSRQAPLALLSLSHWLRQ